MIYTVILIITVTLIGESTGQTIYKDNGDDKPINGLQFDIDIFHYRELYLEDKIKSCNQEVKSLRDRDVQLQKQMKNLKDQNNLIRETDDILQFQLRCENETGTYQERRVANAQYCFMKSSFTWNAGKTKCQSFKSYLLEINSEAEQNWLMDKVSTGKWWTGGIKHPQYDEWVWDHSGNDLTYRNWYPNQPNGGKSEECMLSEDGSWHDYPCDFRFRIICEREK
ncbi:C-type lectin domain family 10 member A-like isoform X2 [Crassostrea angulata]|uniref:C-type lectin domain family 10 member A-like isoform X2 n=1 Tax=Magallana angulata TaxID=2784310 RepID=UPI0022B15482|nr:C-type lectin domain family 10 member A-like isoform X2 [Crassostrea angulata]